MLKSFAPHYVTSFGDIIDLCLLEGGGRWVGVFWGRSNFLILGFLMQALCHQLTKGTISFLCDDGMWFLGGMILLIKLVQK